MKRVVRAAAAAALAIGGTGAIGCTHSGKNAEDPTMAGGHYRTFIDPCYPERYNATARAEVIAPFAQQVNNGNVLNQTIWNWYFETGSDKLTPAGRAKLDSIAQTRPAPDTRLYLQASRDVTVTNENLDKVAAAREDLTAKRAAAIQKYMGTQPVIGNAVAYEIFVHDAVVPGIPSEFPASAFRGQGRGYAGVLPRGGGQGTSGGAALSTGGGGGGNMGGPNTGPTSSGPTPGAAPGSN